MLPDDFQSHWLDLIAQNQITAVGILKADPCLTYPYYRDIIDRGLPPQLNYLAANAACREDFDTILPGTKSILCCAVALPTFPRDAACNYARFCAIGDYHQVMRDRMSRLWDALAPFFPDAAMRICVDTAPVLERELCVRAGLGSIGFNHMMIHPQAGSFIALGEMFLTADITSFKSILDFNVQPQEALVDALTPGALGCCPRDHRLCVAACPTKALSPSGYDFNRCLAYWTTQHKGDIPEEFASAMGDVLWGCDRCQLACPRNRLASSGTTLDSPLQNLTFEEILTLSARQIRKKLAGTSIADAHPYLLVRNACIVIGNLRDSRYSSHLAFIAENHPCDWVKNAASRALSLISSHH